MGHPGGAPAPKLKKCHSDEKTPPQDLNVTPVQSMVLGLVPSSGARWKSRNPYFPLFRIFAIFPYNHIKSDIFSFRIFLFFHQVGHQVGHLVPHLLPHLVPHLGGAPGGAPGAPPGASPGIILVSPRRHFGSLTGAAHVSLRGIASQSPKSRPRAFRIVERRCAARHLLPQLRKCFTEFSPERG